MKKKQANSISTLLALASALLALVAIISIFLPQIVSTVDKETTYNGLTLAFGKKLTDFSKINFSFVNLLAYVLIVAGLVIIALQIAGIADNKALAFVAAVALIVGGILFFFVLGSSSTSAINPFNDKVGDPVKFSEQNSDIVTLWKVGVGSTLGGITAILSGVFAAGKAVLDK